MPLQVVNGATIQCSFCASPGTLVVLGQHRVNAGSMPAANIMDFIPMTNIMPFGACMSPTNPQVAAATAAALGVLTPQPCIPVVTGPWKVGATTVMLDNAPALDNISTNMCTWGGVITITMAGEVTVNIP